MEQLIGALVLREATSEWREGELVGALVLFAVYCWITQR